MTAKRHISRRASGFTLLEVCVTLALVGFVLAMGVRRVDTAAWKLDAAGHQIVQHVRAARTLAVLRQHDVIVSFDIGNRTIVVHEDEDGDGEIGDDERVRRVGLEGQNEFTLGDASEYAGYTAGPVTFSDASVTFTRNGSASEEGAVYVGRPSLDKARIVVISRATGYAEMLRYNGSRWISE
jgi:prepilin-type N-terminal cleavage/methylation domain-containing protein